MNAHARESFVKDIEDSIRKVHKECFSAPSAAGVHKKSRKRKRKLKRFNRKAKTKRRIKKMM